MNAINKIYVAGHRGMVGSAIVRALRHASAALIVTRTHAELDLTNQAAVNEFFEKEKERMREKRDSERAQSIREAILVGETVEDKDRRWLDRFEAAKIAAEQGSSEVAFITEGILEGEAQPASEEMLAEEAEAVSGEDALFEESPEPNQEL